MKTLILAAGYGTRLYPLTENTAKALLSLGEQTLIDVVIDKLCASGADDISVLSNQRFFNDFTDWSKTKDIDIELISDGSESPESMLGAIGDLNFFLNQTSFSGDLLIIGSDNLFSWQLNDFLAYAKNKNASVVGVYDMKDKSLVAKRFGVVEKDKNDRIVTFEEKPGSASKLIDRYLYILFN